MFGSHSTEIRERLTGTFEDIGLRKDEGWRYKDTEDDWYKIKDRVPTAGTVQALSNQEPRLFCSTPFQNTRKQCDRDRSREQSPRVTERDSLSAASHEHRRKWPRIKANASLESFVSPQWLHYTHSVLCLVLLPPQYLEARTRQQSFLGLSTSSKDLFSVAKRPFKGCHYSKQNIRRIVQVAGGHSDGLTLRADSTLLVV